MSSNVVGLRVAVFAVFIPVTPVVLALSVDARGVEGSDVSSTVVLFGVKGPSVNF